MNLACRTNDGMLRSLGVLKERERSNRFVVFLFFHGHVMNFGHGRRYKLERRVLGSSLGRLLILNDKLN